MSVNGQISELVKCVTCKQEKPTACFSKDKKKKSGICSSCKQCSNARSAKWRLENREQFLLLMREWYAKNKDRVYKANKEWAANNKELTRKYGREWARRNKEYSNANIHKRRAFKKQLGGVLSKGLRAKLYKLQRGKCACCGIELNGKYHLDHILPLALGGTNTDDNIQLLSPTCNMKKNKKHPIDYMQSKGFLL